MLHMGYSITHVHVNSNVIVPEIREKLCSPPMGFHRTRRYSVYLLRCDEKYDAESLLTQFVRKLRRHSDERAERTRPHTISAACDR